MCNLTIVEPEVTVEHNVPVTTSLNIAKVFGKEHRNVLRDIDNILTSLQNQQNSTELTFELSEYQDNTGRKLPMYLLSRDACVLLVMGYTGERAMEFKLAYINAFNKMEAKLKEQALPEVKKTESTMIAAKYVFSCVPNLAPENYAIAMDMVARKLTGESPLLTAGIKLISTSKKQYYCPKVIGQLVAKKLDSPKPYSSQAINNALTEMGFQTWERDSKGNRVYSFTELGSPYGEMDVPSKANGSPKPTPAWYEDVVDPIINYLTKEEN